MNCLEFYYNQASFPSGQAMDYLLSRGVSREEVEEFGIKFFDKSLEVKDLSRGDWKVFKDWSKGGYLLREKFVFPLWNTQDQLIAFTFRGLDKFKSKFMSELSDFEGIFYGLKQALPKIWETEEVFITEGPFDWYPLHRLYPNSLALLTANVSSKQLSFFKRYVKRIFSLLDNDEAGEIGFVKLQEKLDKRIELLKIPFLAKDLGKLWENLGEDGFQKAIKNQIDRLILF